MSSQSEENGDNAENDDESPAGGKKGETAGGTMAVDELMTLDQIIKMDEEREDSAVALLGGSLDLVCTYSEGYKMRQPLYSCLTCFAKTGQLAGVCYACSENCHDGHDLVELYSKRRFCCDCGNAKFETKCKLFEEKDAFNARNKYNDNFKGIFCSCKKPYPPDENDAGASVEDMLQCCMCEDWFHPSHIFPPDDQQCSAEEAEKGQSDDIEGLICKDCMSKHSFLACYPLANGAPNCCDQPKESKNGEEKERGECKLEALKKKRGGSKASGGVDSAKSMWVQSGWREGLCRCKECTNLYDDLDCSFLLEPEDTIAYFEQQNREKASQKGDTTDLFQMVVEETKERETALKMLVGIEQMKQHCKEFFEKRAAEKRGPITGDDVEQCFAELRTKRMKHGEEAQQSELNTPGNGPWTQ